MNVIPYFLLVPLAVGCIISLLVTPLVILFAKKYGLVDDPRHRHHPAAIHKGSIPRAGGFALFLGIAIPLLLFLPISPLTISILVSSLLLVVVGLFDDKHDVHPIIRLGTNAIACFIVIAAGVTIPYITHPLGSGILQLDAWKLAIGPVMIAPLPMLLSFVWMYWTMNIVGWSAGVDGQLPGVVVIGAFVLGILSLRYSFNDPTQWHVTILAVIVAGSFLGFLPWNFFPQKIMPGYGGKTLAGFLLAVLSILSYGKLGTALLVLGIPMVDAIFTLFRRLSKGKSPIWADRGHLHHHLLDLGLSKRAVALLYWLFSAILGAIALSVSSTQKIFLFLFIVILVGGFLLWINWAWHFSKPQDHDNG